MRVLPLLDLDDLQQPLVAPKKSTISTPASSKINSVLPSTPSPATPKVEARTAKGDGVSANWTGDKTRDRCVELLYDALAVDSGARAFTIYPVAPA